ncbi:MAG: glycosyltransferase family 39 protein, partial [Chloroflexi bacterium]|nr:glycosyltransferase family 39 protein [Chloroflexota bacterium]
MSFLKRFHWFELALIAIVMGVHIYVAFSAPHNFSTRWFTRDDAYYYFKVAQNISEGHGSSFDGINLTNGYHPLWMLVCVPIFALARFELILPLRILLVVMAALSVTTSILLFRLLKKQVGVPIAMLAASFWAFSMTVHSTITQQGMETGVVALSTVLFLYLLQQSEEKKRLAPRDLVILGLAALFVLFSRLDGIYLVLIAGVWVVFRRTPIRYLLPIDLLL